MLRNRHRLLPALVAVALLPALAACGGDDSSDTTASTGATAATTATATTGAETTPTTATTRERQSGQGSGGSGTSTGGSSASASSNPLSSYVRGGSAASGSEASAVRDGFVQAAVAVQKKDTAAACQRIAGVDALLKAGGLQNVSCSQALGQLLKSGQAATGIPAGALDQAKKADVTIKGSKATIELTGQQLPMIRQGGTWKINLGALTEAVSAAQAAQK